MEKNTKDPEFYDFIQSSVTAKTKNTKYFVGYYKNKLTAIKADDYHTANDRYVDKGDQIKEYDPTDIFSLEKTAEIEECLKK